MAKTNPRMRPDNAAAGDDVSASRGGVPAADERFPPPTISLETFVKNGSDREFRNLIFELLALQNQMQRHTDVFSRYIGATGAQFHAIMIMARTPDLTVSQIAQLMNVTSQFVTIEIGNLVRKGIVEKRPNENDRRSGFLNLTAKGKKLVRELAPLLRRANDLHFRSLTTEQARILRETVHAIVEDGKRVIHELESPDVIDAMAPSAQPETEPRSGAPRLTRKQVRRR